MRVKRLTNIGRTVPRRPWDDGELPAKTLSRPPGSSGYIQPVAESGSRCVCMRRARKPRKEGRCRALCPHRGRKEVSIKREPFSSPSHDRHMKRARGCSRHPLAHVPQLTNPERN